MLWRRYFPEAQTASKTKRREKTHAANRQCRSTTRSLYGGAEVGGIRQYGMKMDLKHALLNEPAHKERVRQVVAYVGKSRTRFKELMDLFQSENYRLCQRASWPLSYIV